MTGNIYTTYVQDENGRGENFWEVIKIVIKKWNGVIENLLFFHEIHTDFMCIYFFTCLYICMHVHTGASFW